MNTLFQTDILFSLQSFNTEKKKQKQKVMTKVMTTKWALLNINNYDKNNDKEF